MTVKEILSRIEYTVIIDGVEHTNRDITFSTWNENMVKQSEKASGYTPEKMFDPVARDNYQKYIAFAYFAGFIPAKVIETRTNEIGEDGCYVFTVETVGTLDPEDDSTDSTDSTDSQPAAPVKEVTEMEYNYCEAVKADVLDYIQKEIDLEEWKGDRDGLEEKLNDDLWTVDSVTGNGSGSYTFNSYRAAEYLAHNWDTLAEALREFGQADINAIEKGPEWCDVIIRCYLLGQAIGKALDELTDELTDELEEDDELKED